MNDENLSDDELEEELDKAYKANENRKNVFSIINNEKISSDIKEKRVKDKFGY